MYKYAIPRFLGEALDAALVKGAGHKYIRRVATGNSKRPWKYYYTVAGGRGLGHHAEFEEGAKFRVAHGGKDGHFEIVGKDGDKLRIRHDESGHESTLAPAALSAMLRKEHAEAITRHKERVKKDLADASKHGTEKQKAKLRELAERYEHTNDLVSRQKPIAKPKYSITNEQFDEGIQREADALGPIKRHAERPESKASVEKKDPSIAPHLSTSDRKKLDYRLAHFAAEKRLRESEEAIRNDAPKELHRWVDDQTIAIRRDPFSTTKIDPATRPPKTKATDAKALARRLEDYRAKFVSALRSAGHAEHVEDWESHKVHGRAYDLVAENLSRELGVAFIGGAMQNDTAGPGLTAVANAALRGKHRLSDVAAEYHSEAGKEFAREAWVPQGGDEEILRDDADRKHRYVELAEHRADVANRLEKLGHAARAKVWESVAERSRQEAAAANKRHQEKRDQRVAAEEQKHQEADKAERERAQQERAMVESSLAPDESVIHVSTPKGKVPKAGVIRGDYAVLRPDRDTKGHSVTHLRTGLSVATVKNKRDAHKLIDELHEKVPGLGVTSSPTNQHLEAASEIKRRYVG